MSNIDSLLPMSNRRTEIISLPNNSIGTRRQMLLHRYGPIDGTTHTAYIQATLHADELPGLLVNHHLIQMLDGAEGKGLVKQRIVVVPYANPIGLSQEILGSHIGRFNIGSGVNFNRDYPSMLKSVLPKIEGKLSETNAEHNVRLIREALRTSIDEMSFVKEDSAMKQYLYREACVADLVIDLHCDNGAILCI